MIASRQVGEVIQGLSRSHRLDVAIFTGGTPYPPQQRALRRPHAQAPGRREPAREDLAEEEAQGFEEGKAAQGLAATAVQGGPPE